METAINCPYCFADLKTETAKEKITCKYCDSLIALKDLEQVETIPNDVIARESANDLLEEMIGMNTKEMNWKDFLDRFITSDSIKKMTENFHVNKEEVVNEVKDSLYEKLPTNERQTDLDESIHDVIERYFTNQPLSDYDLIALAGLIRHGFEMEINRREKNFEITYDRDFPSFGYRSHAIFGTEIKNQVMKHWRNCSAIIHHDDTDELFHKETEEKLNALKQAYNFYLKLINS